MYNKNGVSSRSTLVDIIHIFPKKDLAGQLDSRWQEIISKKFCLTENSLRLLASIPRAENSPVENVRKFPNNKYYL